MAFSSSSVFIVDTQDKIWNYYQTSVILLTIALIEYIPGRLSQVTVRWWDSHGIWNTVEAVRILGLIA